MKIKFILLCTLIYLSYAYASRPSSPFGKIPEDVQASPAHSINVNFSMGNSQQAPSQNHTEAKPTQAIKVELPQTEIKPLPQESAWHRAYMSAIGGAAATAGSYLVTVIYNHGDKVISFISNHGDKIVAVVKKATGL